MDGRDNLGRYFRGIGSGPGSPFWHKVDAGDVHFIALDVEWGLESFTQAQQDWLQQTLAAIDPDDWTTSRETTSYFGELGSLVPLPRRE
jgi:hypothetical protein